MDEDNRVCEDLETGKAHGEQSLLCAREMCKGGVNHEP